MQCVSFALTGENPQCHTVLRQSFISNFSPDLIDVGSFCCLVSNGVVIEVSNFIVGKKKGVVVFDLWIRVVIMADLRDCHRNMFV